MAIIYQPLWAVKDARQTVKLKNIEVKRMIHNLPEFGGDFRKYEIVDLFNNYKESGLSIIYLAENVDLAPSHIDFIATMALLDVAIIGNIKITRTW
ncbi:hypothetical protein [Dickeya phage Sucellus]|nr:hypothetical protein [Dickeya phage Sucellus]